MPLQEIPLPNLLGGVSQQPSSQRAAGQVSACDNALLHVVNGLGKRKGTRHLAKLITGVESVRLVHLIDRDESERYVVLTGERRVRVFSADTGAEFPVKVNGTSTNAGRGKATGGTPLTYLDPRTAGGEIDQDEDFVIGAGDWLSTAANSVTSYLGGRGPFLFGRRESLTAVTADTVAEVGNGAAATVSDIYQDFGTYGNLTVFSVYVKRSTSAINDVELTFVAAGDTYGARFDISGAGVVTLGTLVSSLSTGFVQAQVEAAGNGWYRCSIQLSRRSGDTLIGIVGTTRRIQIRFHTNAAVPENKRVLLFGGRCHDLTEAANAPDGKQPLQPVPAYVHEQPDLFKAVTIADTTLLLNTETTVGATSGTSPSGGSFGFVYVRAGGRANIAYAVILRATDTSTFTATYVPATTALASSENVATQLLLLINADGRFTASGNFGSTFLISSGTKTLATVAVGDGDGGHLITAAMPNGGPVRELTELPDVLGTATKPIVKITGQRGNPADDYYVRFLLNYASSNLDGRWAETLAPSIAFTPSGVTLPQLLTRQQDDGAGTKTGVPNAIYFDISAAPWGTRLVGDTVSNPDPSFVGQKIRDLFLYRGRLGLLADDNVILSEAGEIFNFWRTTVLDLPDTDPLDVSTGARETVLFRNAILTADTLLLFSARRQFQLLGEPTLTPATAQLAPVRSFENLTQCRPVDAGRGVIVARSDDVFSGLMMTSLLQDDLTFRFDDLTVQAPRYITGRALELVHSSLTGLTVARAEQEPTQLFIHQTFHDDQENLLQSAIHRWTLDAAAAVRGMGFLLADLRLVVERAEGWFLETVLTDAEITEGGRPITHLDRRVDQSQVTRAYAGGPDETTITLPYNISPTATMEVVDAVSGLIVPVLSQTTTTVVVHGDMSATNLYVGESYDLEVVLSEPVIQDHGPRGGVIPRMGRALSVNRLFLYLANTAFLEVEVAADLRSASVEEFSAAGLGTGLLLEGVLSLFTGAADFIVLGSAAEIDVTLRNSTPFPSFVESGRWEIVYRQRAGIV